MSTISIANGISLRDSDIVNVDDFIPSGNYNPHHVRLWVIHDHGFVVGAAFEDCLQDAFDELADAGKLDSFKIAEGELADYGPDAERATSLGKACELFDIELLDYVELECPPLSIVALLQATERK